MQPTLLVSIAESLFCRQHRLGPRLVQLIARHRLLAVRLVLILPTWLLGLPYFFRIITFIDVAILTIRFFAPDATSNAQQSEERQDQSRNQEVYAPPPSLSRSHPPPS